MNMRVGSIGTSRLLAYPRFGETVEAKIRNHKAHFQNKLMTRLPEKGQKEAMRILDAVDQWYRYPQLKSFTTLKKNAGLSFTVWDAMGFISRPKKGFHPPFPLGFFREDTQFLDLFWLHTGEKRMVLDKSAIKTDSAYYQYHVEGSPELTVKRHEVMTDRSLYETMTFTNNNPLGSEPVEFTVLLGTNSKDLFQARGWSTSDDFSAKGTLNVTPDNAVFMITSSRLNSHEPNLPKTIVTQDQSENNLFTMIHLTERNPEYVSLTRAHALDDTAVKINVKVMPGESQSVKFNVMPFNLISATMEDRVPNKSTGEHHLANIRVKASRSAFSHLPKVWSTAKKDIQQLTIPIPTGNKIYHVPAAGSPNYMTIFGRDSLLTSWQLLPYNPRMAHDTLRVLAYFQGKERNEFNEAGPGKIMHELHQGELARLGFARHSPYFGTIDATALFVILMNDYYQQTQDKKLLEDLWPNLEKAIDWIERNVNDERNPLRGFLAQRYAKQEKTDALRLQNCGWKDSDSAVRHLNKEDSNLLEDPEYPLALAEVQGYVYGAYKAAATLYRQKANAYGDETLFVKANNFDEKAQTIKTIFNEAYWMEDKQFIATALQGNGNPVPSISSNGLQALWTGIIDEDKAAKMVERLMGPDWKPGQKYRNISSIQSELLSGWGIRTLSSNEDAYDPISYHNGSVWPHDNSIIVNGLKRYGYHKEAAVVSNQILNAARKFKNNRLPELYSGDGYKKFDRTIIPYPETCSPQAWASGTPFSLLTSMLGLQVNMAEKKITLNNPMLPRGLSELVLEDIPMSSNQTVNLKCIRDSKTGRVQAQLTGLHGKDVSLQIQR